MDNKNLIMGSVALLIVVFIAIILFLPKGSQSEVNKIDTSSIKVFKHIEKTEETDGYYQTCDVATDDLVKIYKEFYKAYDLDEENQVSGKSINGDYKVTIDDKYLAFDGNNNIVYLSSINKLYSFESDIYSIVSKVCD